MKSNLPRLLLAALLASTLCPQPSTVQAQTVPTTMSYQGRLTAHGTNFSGTGYFKFALVSADGMTTYWSNDGGWGGLEPSFATSVPVSNGLFTVMLGDPWLPHMMYLDPTTFQGGRSDAQLRTWFCEAEEGVFVQLAPDQPLGSVAYAMMAAKVGPGAIGSTELANDSVTRNKLENNAVNASILADNAVTSNKIAAGAVLGTKIGAAVITGYHIQNGSINLSGLAQDGAAAGQVIRWSGTAWEASPEGGGGLGDGSVTSAKILDGTIVNADISASAAIADTKLSTNVARLDAPFQNFSGGNTFRSLNVVDGPTNSSGSLHVGGYGASGDPKLIYFGDGSYAYLGENGLDDRMELRATEFFINAPYVGIGKTNPATTLDVNGTITATSFTGPGAGLTGLNAGQLTSGALPDARLSANVALRSGGNTFTGNQLISSGNVGIGTASPESALDVRGLATLQLSGVANHDNLRIKKTGALSSANTEFVMSHRSDGAALWLYGYNGATYRNLQGWDHASNTVRFPANGQDLFINESLGRVGVGTASPQQRFHVVGTSRMDGTGSGLANPALFVTNSAAGGIGIYVVGTSRMDGTGSGLANPALFVTNSSTAGVGIYSVTASSDANVVAVNKGAGNLIKGFSGATGGDLVFQVNNAGNVYSKSLQIMDGAELSFEVNNAGNVYCADELSCKSLLIRGGADLAEPFAMSDASIVPGAVVVIDPAQPGRLKLSTQAYDSKVAGIISGAGGVQPGISMIQTEVLEGGRNVALSGRVYALVDAGHAPVEPGDLLTTSATPGHAMKATDAARRSGAILGKAMTPLPKGRGLVLVLVSLQ